MNRRELIKTGLLTTISAPSFHSAAADENAQEKFAGIAQLLKPQLHATPQLPLSLVRAVQDDSTFFRWRMELVSAASTLSAKQWRKGDSFILDFGTHRTGTLSFKLIGEGVSIDAPTRLRLTFGEVPSDVAEAFYPYKGMLSSAWLSDEVINIDFLPQEVKLPRRYAFRYVKIEILDTSPNYAARFEDIQAHALTSAGSEPPPLGRDVPEDLRRIDQVSIATLRDCMQTVFEDGPRRDQRLWIGDLRLQALTNYVTFRNTDLVKRCLYLFAALPREDGVLPACIFEKPVLRNGGTYIMDYSVLYGAAVLDYVRATKDEQTARDLWPVVRRQMEVVGKFVNGDGLFVDPGGWWIFIDWSQELDRTAAMHGVLLYSFRQAFELAQLAGASNEASDYPGTIARMTSAAKTAFYDRTRKLFISGSNHQVSWATQAWLILAGVGSKEEGAIALRNALRMPDAIGPTTPYLYHCAVDAMLTCGMREDALKLLRSYWGGMVKAGADTYWEVYDPAKGLFSPYNDIHINSYCHAWSCTPAYFLRSRGLA